MAVDGTNAKSPTYPLAETSDHHHSIPSDKLPTGAIRQHTRMAAGEKVDGQSNPWGHGADTKDLQKTGRW